MEYTILNQGVVNPLQHLFDDTHHLCALASLLQCQLHMVQVQGCAEDFTLVAEAVLGIIQSTGLATVYTHDG